MISSGGKHLELTILLFPSLTNEEKNHGEAPRTLLHSKRTQRKITSEAPARMSIHCIDPVAGLLSNSILKTMEFSCRSSHFSLVTQGGGGFTTALQAACALNDSLQLFLETCCCFLFSASAGKIDVLTELLNLISLGAD